MRGRPGLRQPADVASDSSETPPILFRGRELQGRKTFWRGTHRIVPPDVTLKRIRPLFSGVGLTRLANVTGLDRIGIPTVLAVRPNAGYLSVDAGKGLTIEAASVSAAMETIERSRAEEARPESFDASYEELARDSTVVALADLPLSKHSLYRPDRATRWTLTWDLLQQEPVAVPYGMVVVERHRLPRTDPLPFQTGSNGLASGNILLEAILSGLLEVVERDGVTLHRVAWDHLGVPPPRVDLEGANGALAEVLGRLDEARTRAVLFDCTVDTGVPTYMAYLYDQVSRHVGIYRGYGAHMAPDVAAVRALTEAVQSRLVFIAGSRDDWFLHNHVSAKGGDNRDTIERLEAIRPTRTMAAHADSSSSSLEGDVGHLLASVRNVGLRRVLVNDLSRGDDPVAVARVIVPGAEGYVTAHYHPGPRARAFLERRARELP